MNRALLIAALALASCTNGAECVRVCRAAALSEPVATVAVTTAPKGAAALCPVRFDVVACIEACASGSCFAACERPIGGAR